MNKKKSLFNLAFLAVLVAIIIVLKVTNYNYSEHSNNAATALVENVDTPTTNVNLDSLLVEYTKIMASGNAVQCNKNTINNRLYVACNFTGVGTRSPLEIWLYDNNNFYALNGTARTTLKNLEQNEVALDYAEKFGLPLPSDINLNAVKESFAFMLK